MDLPSAIDSDLEFEIEGALKEQKFRKMLPFKGMDKAGASICPFFQSGTCEYGDQCPLRHLKDKGETVVCKHWLRGLCKYGDNCVFLHDYDMSKMPDCYFYSKFGECNSGVECSFLHIDPESRIKECAWYNRGFCRHGPTCKNAHIRKIMCQNYLTGFCPNGKSCKHEHPQFELPNASGIIANTMIPGLSIPPFVLQQMQAIEQKKDPSKSFDMNESNRKKCKFCKGNGHLIEHCNRLPLAHRRGYIQLLKLAKEEGRDPNEIQIPSCEPLPLGPNADITCYKCNEKGHYANNCPSRLSSNRRHHIKAQ